VTDKRLAELLALEEQKDEDLKDIPNNESEGSLHSLLLRGRGISTSQESSITILYETRKSF
jgi:hypothetical protein